MRKQDVIVVGSGLGGLSAAAHLAHQGKKVLLLERYSILGGSSHVFGRRGRWEFDCGIHYVSHCEPGGTLAELLRGLGLGDRLEWLPLDPQGFDRIIGPGFELATPFGWDEYLVNLLASFPGEEKAVRRFHGVMHRLGSSIARDDMSSVGVARGLRSAGGAAIFSAVPYAAFLVWCGFSARSTLALSVQCGALATSPTSVPTVAMAGFLNDYVGTGAYYPRGGGQEVATAFAEVVEANGGEIRTNAEVARIRIESGAVQGVELADGEKIDAPVVVSDADIIETYSDLVGLEHLSTPMRARVRTWRMSKPLINGFFGVDHDVSNQPNSNYFVIPTWEDATSLRSLNAMSQQLIDGKGFTDGRDWAHLMAARQPMFVQSSSRRDPDNAGAAPAGCSTIEVQTITPADPSLWGHDGMDIDSREYRTSERYLEIKQIVLDGMLQRMEQAFPGSSARVEIAELGTPATQTRFVGNTGGAPFGLKMRMDQIGPTRPGSTTSIRGLLLASTSTRWGPGTVGSMISGARAASVVQ